MKEESGTLELNAGDIYNESTLVYLIDRDENELLRQFVSIKASKEIVTAYFANGRHYLLLQVQGNLTKTKIGVKNGNKRK